MKNIAKSPEMIAKEAEIQDLTGRIKKARTTLKRLKTRLQNTQDEFVNLQRTVQNDLFGKMSAVQDVIDEIIEYAKKLIKSDFLSREDKDGLKFIVEDLTSAELFPPEFAEYNEHREKAERGEIEFDFDEEARAKAHNLFAEFKVEPPKEEQREIRKVYISLSAKFHPDKAKNDKEREEFTGLIQEIIAAYENNDIEKLLEIERLYVDSETIDFRGKAVTVDVLTQEVERLKRELSFIENQVSRTSEAIKNFRQSDYGQALTQNTRAEKAGMGLSDNADTLDQMSEQFTQLRDALQETWEMKELSPKIMEMISPASDMSLEEEALMQMFGVKPGGGEMSPEEIMNAFTSGGFFGPDDDDEFEEIDNPTFKYGQTVEVANDLACEFAPQVNMKGWRGKVFESYLSNGEEACVVCFDEKTIEKMPVEYIEAGMYEEDELWEEYTFRASELKAVKYKHDEFKADAMQEKRRLEVKYGDVPKETTDFIKGILGKNPKRSDLENWIDFLKENIKFPLDVKGRGKLNGTQGKPKGQLTGFAEPHPFAGLIVEFKHKRKTVKHPLLDFKAAAKNKKTEKILDAYYTWADAKYY